MSILASSALSRSRHAGSERTQSDGISKNRHSSKNNRLPHAQTNEFLYLPGEKVKYIRNVHLFINTPSASWTSLHGRLLRAIHIAGITCLFGQYKPRGPLSPAPAQPGLVGPPSPRSSVLGCPHAAGIVLWRSVCVTQFIHRLDPPSGHVPAATAISPLFDFLHPPCLV